MKSSVISAAEARFGSRETNGTIDIDSNCYLEMFEEVYAETGEVVFRQRYVSYNIE